MIDGNNAIKSRILLINIKMSQTSYCTHVEPVMNGGNNDQKYQSDSKDESLSELTDELDFDTCIHL